MHVTKKITHCGTIKTDKKVRVEIGNGLWLNCEMGYGSVWEVVDI